MRKANLLCYVCLSSQIFRPAAAYSNVLSSNNIALAITATVINMPISFVIERMQTMMTVVAMDRNILNYCPMFLVASKEFAYMILYTQGYIQLQRGLANTVALSNQRWRVYNLCIAIDLTFFSIYAQKTIVGF